MDNFKNLSDKVNTDIDPNGSPGSILAQNHNDILQELLIKQGKYVGMPFLFKSNWANVISAGEFFLEGALNGNVIARVSEKTTDGTSFAVILKMHVQGDVIHFKDFEGRSFYFYIVSITESKDVNNVDFYQLELEAFQLNQNYTYQPTEIKIGMIEFIRQNKELKSLSYSALVELKSESKLIPGVQYRINDYVTKVGSGIEFAESQEEPFDIIVTANSKNELSEKAKAIKREGSTYFPSETNFNAWELKYCLENDNTRFEWADTVNGLGVIYYMKDEFQNELYYDFKNIKFRRFKVISVTDSNLESIYLDKYLHTGETNYVLDFDLEDSKFLFTFNNSDDEDDSLVESKNNRILPYFTDKYVLNNIVFSGNTNHVFFASGLRNTFLKDCEKSNFGQETTDNYFGNVFLGNQSFDNFKNNVIGNNFENNVFNHNFKENILGTDYTNNIFGNNFTNNTCGNDFDFNSFGNNFSNNIIGSDCDNNIFGNNIVFNSLGDNFIANQVGHNFNANNFAGNTQQNIFLNDTQGNIFGTAINSNKFGNSLSGNTFGDDLFGNNFGNTVQNCQFENFIISNTFGNNIQFFFISSNIVDSLFIEDGAKGILGDVINLGTVFALFTNPPNKLKILKGSTPGTIIAESMINASTVEIYDYSV